MACYSIYASNPGFDAAISRQEVVVNVNTIPSIGDKVLAYNSNKDKFFEAEVIRVYDEDIYRKEHYGDDIPEWDNPALNDPLVDIRFIEINRVSKAHFVWGLQNV